MTLSDMMKTIERKARLLVIYFWRILFAENHLKCPWYKKLRANLFGGYLADQWVLYDFDHNDKKEYLSEYDWYRSRYINEPFSYIFNNKVVTSELLKHYVRVPETYFVRSKGFLFNSDGRTVDYSEAVEKLKQKGEAFIKPIDRGKGSNVSLLSYREGQLFFGTQPYSDDMLIDHLKSRRDWFLSESIKQHAYASALFDKTINTIRIITLRSPQTNQFEVFFAVQRIGTEKTIPVDNGSQGGLIAKIDLRTGELSEARSLHNLCVYTRHPDSDNQIEGVVIPDWDSIMEQVLFLSNKLSWVHFIAWDVLKTKDGICVIEANNSSGVNIIQLWGGQRNKELGDFYRFHGVIK